MLDCNFSKARIHLLDNVQKSIESIESHVQENFGKIKDLQRVIENLKQKVTHASNEKKKLMEFFNHPYTEKLYNALQNFDLCKLILVHLPEDFCFECGEMFLGSICINIKKHGDSEWYKRFPSQYYLKDLLFKPDPSFSRITCWESVTEFGCYLPTNTTDLQLIQEWRKNDESKCSQHQTCCLNLGSFRTRPIPAILPRGSLLKLYCNGIALFEMSDFQQV